MNTRAIINVYNGLDSTSLTDALSANMGRELKELIDNVTGGIECIDLNDIDINTQIGEFIIGYGNGCINKPSGVGNGYLINIPHSDSTQKLLYNKQFWIERIKNRVWIRKQENGTFGDWECLSHTIKTTGSIKPTREEIDGKQVYVKRINFGSLPDTGTKGVASGLNLSDITVVDIKGIVRGTATTNGNAMPLPFSNPNNVYSISCYLHNNGNVIINTGSDRTAYKAYVDIYFTYNN